MRSIIKKETDNIRLSIILILIFYIYLLSVNSSFAGWFFLPLFITGVILLNDVLNWFKGAYAFFDPVGILSLFSFHFFFLVPCLHILWDIWFPYAPSPPDWLPWIGIISIFNLIGVVVYRRIVFSKVSLFPKLEKKKFILDYKRAMQFLFVALLVCALLQAIIYYQSGGISGYISIYESRHEGGSGFKGLGWLFTISESFPRLLIVLIAIYYLREKKNATLIHLGAFLMLYLIISLLFGGLRGSRSNTIWMLFYAVFIIHHYIRRIPKYFYVVGVCFLMGFMYLYSFYKAMGSEAMKVYSDLENIESYENESGKSFETVLLWDLGRTDVQALLIYKLMAENHYELAYGKTYLASLGFFIPKSIWENRPVGKVKEGTNLQYGANAYEQGMSSSRIYGLLGEFILNFSILLSPIAFAIYGFLVKYVREMYSKIDLQDPRFFLVPLLINFSFLFLGSDSSNYLFFLFKNGLIIFLFTIFSRYKLKVIKN